MLSKEELEVYCKEYYLQIYKYCMSRLSNKQDAEDAAQETFVVFSEKAHLLEDEHIQTWLFTTAHHMVLREYRRRFVEKDKEAAFDEKMMELSKRQATLEGNLVDYYFERFTSEIYARLTDKEKELFDLCSEGNLGTGEIARILGIDSRTCSMRKKRLNEKCKQVMLEILFY